MAMNAREDVTMRALGNQWLSMERQLSGNISALANEMVRRAEAGEVITEAMVRRAERYQILQAQMKAEIAKYNKEAASIISTGQENALQLGIDAAQNAITTMLPVAERAAFNRINIKAVEAMIGYAGDGSPLNSLLKNEFGVATDGMLQALINGVATGQGADPTARAMMQGVDMGLDRSLLIARTEMNRAYRSGSTEQYRESGVVVKFKRLVARDEACASCLALDGEEFDSADELDDHPNGRCTVVPVIEGIDSPTWQEGSDWFSMQDEARQRDILGPGRFELYKGGMPLSDMVHKTHSDEWGDSPALIPLRDLQK
jgi:hypothetical protein